MAEFATAPPSIRESLANAQKTHEAEFANLLQGKVGADANISAPGPLPDDPRQASNGEEPTEPSISLPFLESEAAMKSQHKIIGNCKTFDAAGVQVFIAEDYHVFLLSKDWVFEES